MEKWVNFFCSAHEFDADIIPEDREPTIEIEECKRIGVSDGYDIIGSQFLGVYSYVVLPHGDK